MRSLKAEIKGARSGSSVTAPRTSPSLRSGSGPLTCEARSGKGEIFFVIMLRAVFVYIYADRFCDVHMVILSSMHLVFPLTKIGIKIDLQPAMVNLYQHQKIKYI